MRRPASVAADLAWVALLAGLISACSGGDDGGDLRPAVLEGHAERISELSKRDDLNLLFILIDTLRADRLHYAGYERETSPMLDYLALTGISFQRHASQSSWTKTSMASMWTSLYPVHTGVLRAQNGLPTDARLPAEVLRDAGFRTAGIWRNGWVSGQFGFGQGFYVYDRPTPRPVRKVERRRTPHAIPGSDSDAIDSATAFLRQHHQERFFLYLHLMDIHQYVYDEDTAIFGTSLSDVYDNSILHTDDLISLLLGQMNKLELLDKTIIVIGSDHGDAFGEHGIEGHARDLHAEVTHVPLVISLPIRLRPGVAITDPTENVDIWPTLYDLLGLPLPPDLDGRSVLPQILKSLEHGSSSPVDRGPRFAYLDRSWGRIERASRPLVAVEQGIYRLHYDGENPAASRLYDMHADPGELKNLFAAKPDVAARLAQQAVKRLSETAVWPEVPTLEIDEMQLNQLRALGYHIDE